MISGLILSMALQAAPEAAAAPDAARPSATGQIPAKLTFCGRMVGPYRMRPAVFGKGTVYVTQLKGMKGRIGYSNSFDRDEVPSEHLSEYEHPCTKTAYKIRCVMRGPGELTVYAGGAEARWPINKGEEAIVDYDGDRLACLDFRSE
jgi:hypothetical protein